MLVELLLHQLPDDAEEPLPLGFLGLLGGEAVGVAGEVVHHRGEEHGPRRGQGQPRPSVVDTFRMRHDPRHFVIG